MDELPLQNVITNLESEIRDHEHEIKKNQEQIKAIRAGNFEYRIKLSMMWSTPTGARIMLEGNGLNKDIEIAKSAAKTDLIEKLNGKYPSKPYYEELIMLEFKELNSLYFKQTFPKSI